MTLEELKRGVSELTELVKTGDLDLEERRATYKEISNAETFLDDALLIEAVALTNDDDDDLFVINVNYIQDNGPPTKTGKMPKQPDEAA